MALDAAKEAALRRVLPQHDIELSRIVENVFVIVFGSERGV